MLEATVRCIPSLRSAGHLFVLASIIALVLTACGGSDAPSTAPIEPASSPAVPEVLPAQVPESEQPDEPPTETSDTAPQPAQPDTTPVDPPGLESVVLVEIAFLEQPLDLTTRAGDPRLYVAQKAGIVRVIEADGTVASDAFLDLRDRVSTESERGLLGITFAPDGERFYAHFSDTSGAGHLTSWAVNDAEIDLTSEIDHMVVAQPFSNHNGGRITFGPDGFLYWGLGDGGSGGDPEDNGQNRGTLLGSVLRIDPLADADVPYRIPPDNPFIGDGDARDEIWIWGLRNPWKFSFDTEGGIWIGDVGQSSLEEVDYLPAGAAAGANLGWNGFEGTARFDGDPPPDTVPPVFEYDHDTGVSITGGFVYRGEAIPALRGAYVFGDFSAGFVAALTQSGDAWSAQLLPVEVPQLASFAEDQSGELYALSLSGSVFRFASG